MQLYPCLRYRDAAAALDWLERAFGFERVVAHDGPDGTIAHAEMRWGGSMLMLGTTKDDDLGDHAGRGFTYVACDDPDALFERATKAGAEVVRPLQDLDYGSRDFSVRDPEGNLWSFGTYEPA